MTVTRESVLTALFTLLQTASGFNSYSRRFKMWNQVKGPDMPALLLCEKPEQAARGKELRPAIRTLNAEIWIYINTGKDQNTIPATTLNNLIDVIDPVTGGVLAPGPMAKQTLGGLITDCYIDGEITKVPGDLDGEGMALIPIKIIFMQP